MQVYYYCSLMDGKIAKLSSERFTDDVKDGVRRIFRKRWDEFSSALHCAAYALDPEFQEHRFNSEVMRGLRNVCKLVLGNTIAAKQAMLGRAGYVGKEGDFGNPMVMEMRDEMASYQ